MNVQPHGECRDSGNEVRFRVCPACGHSKWSVSMHPGTGAWYCFKCEAHGSDPSHANARRNLSVLGLNLKVEWGEVALPTTVPLSEEARDYLEKRGLTNPEKFGIVEVENSTRLLFPYYGKHGKVIFWSTRSYRPDGKPKYMTASGKHPLYVTPNWGPHETVVIVEGIMDALLTHNSTGLPVVALGGKALPRYLELDLRTVAPGHKILLLDPDALSSALSLKVRIGDCKLIVLPDRLDPADYFAAGRTLEEV
jgi:hypothetical protein